MVFAFHVLTQLPVEPPLAKYTLFHRCNWRTQGHQWEFRSYWSKHLDFDTDSDKVNLIYRDGSVFKRFTDNNYRPNSEPSGYYLGATVVTIKSPYEKVMAIRAAGGIGTYWDTVFYGFTRGRMTYIGHAPELNSNGPIALRGKETEWLFDDYNRYRGMEGVPVTKHLVYRIDAGRPMTLVRKWKSRTKLPSKLDFEGL